MNGQINTTYRQGAAAIKLALSINLFVGMVLPTVMIPAYAQADFDQSSLLPPEVVPIQQSSVGSASSQSLASSSSQTTPSSTGVPGLVSNPNVPAAGQSAQDMRNQVFNQLMGKGNYPQFDNQNNQGQGAQPTAQYNQAPGQYNQAPGQYNQAPGQYNQAPSQYNQAPAQPLGQSNQPLVQANQSVGQSNWMTPQQNSAMANALPAQTQTLSGNVQNASAPTPAQSGYGFSHNLSALSAFGMAAFALGMGRGSGGYYSGALMGASLINYGLRSGSRF
jgi:hypothetical protein